jgi:hypothetical protein
MKIFNYATAEELLVDYMQKISVIDVDMMKMEKKIMI